MQRQKRYQHRLQLTFHVELYHEMVCVTLLYMNYT